MQQLQDGAERGLPSTLRRRARRRGMIACKSAVMKKAKAIELVSTRNRRQRVNGCAGCARKIERRMWLLLR